MKQESEQKQQQAVTSASVQTVSQGRLLLIPL